MTDTKEPKTTVPAEELYGRSTYIRYIAACYEHNRLEVLTTISPSGAKALPVFASPASAEEFLSLGMFRSVWQVREATAGELISLLMGYALDTREVIFDPSPIPDPATADCLSRKSFINFLMSMPLVVPETD